MHGQPPMGMAPSPTGIGAIPYPGDCRRALALGDSPEKGAASQEAGPSSLKADREDPEAGPFEQPKGPTGSALRSEVLLTPEAGPSVPRRASCPKAGQSVRPEAGPSVRGGATAAGSKCGGNAAWCVPGNAA